MPTLTDQREELSSIADRLWIVHERFTAGLAEGNEREELPKELEELHVRLTRILGELEEEKRS